MRADLGLRLHQRLTSSGTANYRDAETVYTTSRTSYAQCTPWAGFATAVPTGFFGTSHSETSGAHGFTLPSGNRRNHATYYASARSRCRTECRSGYSFTGPEARKESGPWHMARPSDDCPWRGYTQQNQVGRN